VPLFSKPEKPVARASALGSALDSLVQTFENCRQGLTDDALAQADRVEQFFLEIYAKEAPRIRETVMQLQTHLPEGGAESLVTEVDQLARRVVLPAYVRHAQRFTERERKDFYLVKSSLRFVERAAWTLAGVAIGALVVWAPFIPLWSKEWVLPFALAGLFFPELRGWLANRRYEREINLVVARADQEMARMEVAYLVGAAAARESGQPLPAEGAALAKIDPAGSADSSSKRRVH
jgi:hypothetical protein